MRGSLLVLLVWACSSSLASWPGSAGSSGATSTPTAWGSSAPTTSPPILTWSVERLAARQVGVDPLLLEALCTWETRGERPRGAADSALGDGRASIGRCQVQVGTAAWQLGLRAHDLTPPVRTAIRTMLHRPLLNAHFAAQELAWCLGNRPTIERAIGCYQGGRRSVWRGPTIGTKNVLSRYAARKLAELRGRM